MAFKKGTSGNPAGRPKGKKPKPVKARIEGLLEKNLPLIEKEMEGATPQDRWGFFTDLAGVVYSENKQTV